MNRVFIDSSFWITYREETEARWSEAQRILTGLFRQRTHFVTTLPVICEIHANFSRNPRKRALILKDLCHNPLVTIENVSHQDHKEALELLSIHKDKTYPLCDALSFVIMRRLKIASVLAFDIHFRQFGQFEIIS
ncbi:MAG TPA: PIN domain-containing protein [Verrucomicrobiae bacterium]|jgi:predicted nucleic acid-binding protein